MTSGSVIYLVDDDADVRDAVAMFLRQSGYTVKTYGSGAEFLADFSAATVGCILLDLHMPASDGLDVQQSILKITTKVPIIFLTGYGTVRDTVSAVKAGAFDFLEKPCAQENLLDCVRAAVHQCQAARAADQVAAESKANYESLSARQREILALIAKGQSSKQIGRQLGISPRTVDAHRARLMAKMHAASIAELGAISALFSESAEVQQK